MAELDPFKQGGPTYFFLLMEVMSLLNGEAWRSVIDHLKNMSLCNFKGENIDKASTQICRA
eukprot:10833974-Ditylum_brightwellii.AAC.1